MNKNPIKTGICSYGMSGKLFHAPFIQAHPGFTLSALLKEIIMIRESDTGSKLYRSVEELCADKPLQLINVNTPTHLILSR
jgi:predicted dehydrogenase